MNVPQLLRFLGVGVLNTGISYGAYALGLFAGLRYELISSGALFAYVRHPFAGQTAKQVAMRLAGEHDLLVLPGSMFGPGQEDYLRVAFANAEVSDMELLVDRLMESQG